MSSSAPHLLFLFFPFPSDFVSFRMPSQIQIHTKRRKRKRLIIKEATSAMYNLIKGGVIIIY
jgi:hypothetical protein